MHPGPLGAAGNQAYDVVGHADVQALVVTAEDHAAVHGQLGPHVDSAVVAVVNAFVAYVERPVHVQPPVEIGRAHV